VRLVITALVCLLSLSSPAATFYVTKSGNDSNAGSQASPWLTIQKSANTAVAGDTVNISSGDFDEYVQTVNSGSSGSPITFQANPTNAAGALTMREFRIKNRFITLSGLTLTKMNDLNNAAIRIDGPGAVNNGSDYVITNCTIKDMCFLLSRTADFGSNYVHIRDAYEGVDFNNAGFKPGQTVFWGADSLKFFTNHGTSQTVLSNSADGKTMYVQGTLPSDIGTNYWIAVAAGTDNSTYKGILAPLASAVGASNGVIVNCTITNWLGPAIVVSGNNISIKGNDLNHLHGQYAMQLQCSQSTVDHNFIHDSPNIEWFTPDELTGAAHPLGGGFYDWQCNVVASFNNGVSNILFEYNWIQGVDNQLTQIQAPDNSPDDASGFTMVSNVFVNVMMHGSFSRNNTTINHNTFVDSGYMIGEFNTLGQVWGTHGNVMTNPIIVNNVFVNNGEHATTANEPPYAVTTTDPTLSVGTVASNNFSVFPETINWAATPATLGVSNNAADPVFVNKRMPLGPDGLPFTADDGLRPLANSPLVTMGGVGALIPLPFSSRVPVAHFSAVLTSPGWKDATGTNYNPAWAALTPDARGGTIRPPGTPEALGQVPVNVPFDASQSIGGLYTNGVGNYVFAWTFGDGATALTPRPQVNHIYTLPGTNWVTLYVTNLYGGPTGWSVYSNAYRTLAGGSVRFVRTNGNDSTGDGLTTNTAWRTIQKSATSASANWVIDVGPGNYGELVDCTQTAGTGRITFVGHGSRTGGFNLRNSFYAVEGFELDGTGVGAFAGLLYCYAATTNIWAYNNYGHNVTNIYFVEMPMTGGATPGFGSQFDFFSNNVAKKIHGPCFDLHGNGHLVTANIEQDSESEGDFIRLFGANHTISYNYCTNLSAYGGGGHADFIQTFGDSTSGQFFGATNCWIIGNVDVGNVNTGADPIGAGANGSQVCQFEHDDNATTFTAPYTNIYFINNIFAYISYAANVDLDGTEWYNNLFYKVNNTNASPVFAFGGTKGSAFGTKMRNNAFIGCGTGNQFYPNVGDVTSNWGLDADYDYAGTVTGGAAASSWGTQSREAHGVSGGNPNLVSVADNDFHLNTGSPLIGAGQSQSALFTLDNDRQTRSSTWDIGPLAFSTGIAVADPTVNVQPASQAVCATQGALFTLTASGNTTLSYQWKTNGVNAGTNGPSLGLQNCQTAWSGMSVVCRVTDTAGFVDSVTVTLTVNPDPTINTQPQNQSVTVGQTATFTISASSCSSLTLSHQWTFNGVNVSTSSSYVRANCQLADSGGVVQDTVTDSSGSVTSSTATLTVTGGPPPAVTNLKVFGNKTFSSGT
jgi:hypothetical protein